MGIYAGKTVIITGGGKAKSIGYGVATAFAKEGANLVVTGRNKGKLDGAKELERYGIEVLPLQADGGDENAVSSVIAQTTETFGRIDVLVNCAQASKSGVPLVEQSADDFRLAIHAGLYATFFFMRASYPYLKETQGSVINFASGAGLSGNPGQASYAAAKEGIRGLSRVAAQEWAVDDINVNVVCPLAKTGALEQWEKAFPEAYAQNLRGIPMGRFGDPEYDIGRVCVFLGSEDARYMTGETLTLQGGAGLRP